ELTGQLAAALTASISSNNGQLLLPINFINMPVPTSYTSAAQSYAQFINTPGPVNLQVALLAPIAAPPQASIATVQGTFTAGSITLNALNTAAAGATPLVVAAASNFTSTAAISFFSSGDLTVTAGAILSAPNTGGVIQMIPTGNLNMNGTL